MSVKIKLLIVLYIYYETLNYYIAILNEVSPALEQLVYMFKIPSTTKPIVFVEL